MKTTLFCAAAFAALTVSAVAVDLSSSTNAPAPAPAPSIFTWAAAYVSANVGYAVKDDRTDYGYSDLPGDGVGNFSDFFGNAAEADLSWVGAG